MKDNTILLWVAGVLAAVVVTTLGATAIVCRHVEKMAELGYQEEILPGSSMSYWRKCK